MTAHAGAISTSPTVPAVTKQLVYRPELADRVAIMLDLPEREWPGGEPIPSGWHFALIGAETPRSDLRDDGFPGLGVPMPRLPGQRLVAGGRKVVLHAPVHIGQKLERTSRIVDIATKPAGITIISVAHSIADQRQGTLLIEESQTYLQLDTPYETPPAGAAADYPIIKTVTPDETLLFQFSALSFNTHKIHLDRDYAHMAGYPYLVVNGGLTTLLMTEIAREILDDAIKGFSVKNAAPLFCSQPIAFARAEREGRCVILAINPTGHIAAEMEVETDVL
jgi:3-methylfumaryl-CoA hydratase